MSKLQQLQARKERLEDELRHVEKQVYDLETSYLNDSSQYGNVLKGFEGFLAPSKTNSLKKSRNFKTEDRLFSLSSTSSPAAEELRNNQNDMKEGSKKDKGNFGGSKSGFGAGRPKRDAD
uniref:Chromatin modification-related protein MEAF6 n=1 Tax=Pyramimonas obovata TaxID=1411642 RepID=A0A7S0WTP7_9CHLO|mmetsp:Transcript_39630/g.86356  ORF Transcript_39630/g.86356 Transcript_39630/m.86356 type:complete len:120 (+) Transcript_39630:290-649(+)|eukprot:CAMPEP_0118932552 /NCGR_PEP_ID=MMETSP1169-20130426/10488_1 /TAXON_ID=36882 /ORGANISM="Pyramimonas obovata, Strain CCMP722" /LENGTH=119 /DNA_ID=CAMNT_0006875223 /DNA_START=272 /DNA_END=631 /DNA_ORIENTATION=-